MTAQPKHRWIETALEQSQSDLPPLPWARVAKRARRSDKAKQIASVAAQ